MAKNNNPEHIVAINRLVLNMQVQELISSGLTRQQIISELRDQGLSYDQSLRAYNAALRDMAPEPDFLDDYKRGIIQLNLDRLEKIINETIGGNFQSKAVALKAISEINKMIGVTDGNKVTIAQKDKNDNQQIIEIDFSK